MFVADGGKSVRKVLDPVKEPFRPEMKQYDNASDIGVYDMWQLQAARTEVCKQYLDRWNDTKLDAILCQ
jgi:amidase